MNEVDKYLNKLDSEQKTELERVRIVIKHTVPNTEEVMSYGMPAFKYNNRPLIYYAAFKDHISIFPTSPVIKNLKKELYGHKISKGTIQFTIEKPLSENLLTKILKVRKLHIDTKQK